MKYPSKLPQRTYATTLEEQLEQLKTDELAVRFAESRARQSSDPYRPTYHYVNPEGPSNDPNGFTTWQGRYHLFYQQYPPEDLDTGAWNGIMSLPSRLRMGPGKSITNEPVASLETLRTDHHHVGETQLPANCDIPMEGVSGNAIEIIAVVDPQEAREVCIEVLRSEDGTETTSIRYLRNGEAVKTKGPETFHDALVIDTCRTSLLPDVLARPPETARFKLDDGELLELRIFVDKSIVEIFANNRRYMTVRVHPSREDSLGVRMRAHGSDALLRSLDVWQMKNIWDQAPN